MAQFVDPGFVAAVRSHGAALQGVRRNSGDTGWEVGVGLWVDKNPTIPANGAGAGTEWKLKGSNAGAGVSNGGSIVCEPGGQSNGGLDGRFVVRQPGGVAGTNEVQIYNDGAMAYAKNAQNTPFRLCGQFIAARNVGDTGYGSFYANTFYDAGTPGAFAAGNGWGGAVVGAGQGWGTTPTADAAGSNPDTIMYRIAPGVYGFKDSSAVKQWVQNSAGRPRNTADRTNATNVMANLADLSITVATGRKYSGFFSVFASNSTAAEGLAFDFNGGSATMTDFKAAFVATPIGVTLGTSYSTALATALTATTATTATDLYMIFVSFVCNVGGTVIARFAENSAHVAGTASVLLGSAWLMDDMAA
jgi:hypothetical protein